MTNICSGAEEKQSRVEAEVEEEREAGEIKVQGPKGGFTEGGWRAANASLCSSPQFRQSSQITEEGGGGTFRAQGAAGGKVDQWRLTNVGICACSSAECSAGREYWEKGERLS